MRLHTHEEQSDATNNHGNNGTDLHEREPELCLAEGLDLRQVDGEQNQQHRDNPNPRGAVREPELHVHGEGGHIRDGHQRHFEGVAPTGHKAGPTAQVEGRILGERAGDRVRQGELAHCAHHHEHRRAADNVCKQHGGARQLNRGSRTVEQTRADGRSEGDEHNVAQGEASRELSALRAAQRCRCVRGGNRVGLYHFSLPRGVCPLVAGMSCVLWATPYTVRQASQYSLPIERWGVAQKVLPSRIAPAHPHPACTAGGNTKDGGKATLPFRRLFFKDYFCRLRPMTMEDRAVTAVTV